MAAIPAAKMTARELNNAVIGVSDELTDAEFAAFEEELENIGISNYCRVEGRMAILISEGQSIEDFRSKHRQAAKFFQTLRAQRSFAADTANSVEMALQEFDAQFSDASRVSN